MSGVKRYRPLHKQVMVYIRETDYCTYADSPGDMVLASDYDALAQRCAELEVLLRGTSESYAMRCDELQNMRIERDTLRAEVEARDARIASLFQAIAHGDQPHREWLEAAIDAHFSGGRMPDQVPSETERLKAEVERLREIREIASQCAANGGYLNSRDLIDLRNLLEATK